MKREQLIRELLDEVAPLMAEYANSGWGNLWVRWRFGRLCVYYNSDFVGSMPEDERQVGLTFMPEWHDEGENWLSSLRDWLGKLKEKIAEIEAKASEDERAARAERRRLRRLNAA